MIIVGTHDPILVALSILIAIAASYVALDLAGRIRASLGWPRRLWLSTAAVAMGGGIWAMHFVAMLAFRLPGMGFSYDPGLTILSLLLAIGCTGVGFLVVSGWLGAPGRLQAAGLFMGLGVVAMHYVGMAAMRMQGELHYNPRWVSISVVIAVGAATTALWLSARDRSAGQRIVAAIVMGFAVAGMHYAGMAGAIFTAPMDFSDMDDAPQLGRLTLAYGVIVATAVILILSFAAAMLDRRFAAAARREARDALRLQFADLMRDETSVYALRRASALLGQHFGVTRTGFGQLDPVEDMFDYEICWTDGSVKPVLGRLPTGSAGPRIFAELNAGRTVAIGDFATDPLADADTRRMAAGFDTRALLVVPFVRDGRLRTIVYLSDRHPHRWQADEIALMEELAERTRQLVARAEIEAELRQLNASLEARIEERTAELQRAEAALRQSQKMEAIGQLTGGIAHDFNNMLTGVIGNLDLLRRRLDAGRTEGLDRYIDSATSAAQRAASLTARLLAFARRQPLDARVVDVGGLVAALDALIATTVGDGIAWTIAAAAGEVHARVDPHQLENAILNLAINARDAMAGGGALTIAVTPVNFATAEDVPAPLELSPGDYAAITVRDTGVGMTREMIERIVEPFFTTKPVGQGTGLGLSMVYGFARQSAGDLRFESREGEGTAVTIYLPVAAPAGEVAVVQPGPLVSGSGETILLVEDDATVRALVRQWLDDLGYAAIEAGNGGEALPILAADRPIDMMITDFSMPGVNGRELADTAQRLRPGLPILIATGYADQAADRDAFLGPDMALMIKPFALEALAEQIAAMLSSRG